MTADGHHEPIRLSADAPCDRTIDLGQLTDFSEPGEYQVQLIYDSTTIADQKKDAWEGCCAGSVFRAVIKSRKTCQSR